MTTPCTFEEMRKIVYRAEFRWRKRKHRHGSWTHPLVVEAMYLVKALHNTWRTGEAYE